MLNKNYLLVALAFFSVIALSFVSPYTAPTLDSINFSLCSGYTAPTFDSINFTLGLDDACPPVDSCTYPGSGDWNITMSDFCILNTDTNITTNDIIFFGEGNCTINATIEVANIIQPTANGNVYIDSNSRLIVG